MQNPLNSVTANELVERYIGTAYDNVKAVAGDLAAINAVVANEANINLAASLSANVNIIGDNIDNINTVATDITNVNTVAGSIASVTSVAGFIPNVNIVAGDSAAINIVAGDTIPINALAGIEAQITAVNGALTNVNTVGTNLSTTNTIGTVATDIANVNAVGTSIANVNTVAGVTGDMTAVIGNSANINTVATNIGNVNDVAANIANINAVNANETNIDFVANNLPEITSNAGIITMSAVELTLALNNDPEVAGVNYNTVEAAYNYAKTVLQVGGKLTLTIAESTTITDTWATPTIDLNRMAINIVGSSKTTSVLEGNIQYIFSGSAYPVTINLVKFNTQEGPQFNNVNLTVGNVHFTQTNVVSGEAVYLYNNSYSYFGGCDFTAPTTAILVGIGSTALFVGANTYFTATHTTSDMWGIKVTENSKVILFDLAFSNLNFAFPNRTTGAAVAMYAKGNSTILNTQYGMIFDGNETVQYSPSVNTYGNFYSRIITVA